MAAAAAGPCIACSAKDLGTNGFHQSKPPWLMATSPGTTAADYGSELAGIYSVRRAVLPEKK